ncbi:hypothetical protein HYH02_006447 [Chlamydomonas schloesseri]|uniref:Helicase C-terminal domain-containing protein n=1 Tax=Chlamydomonas schloesseri TaxID=2026947 RepID=A0A835WJG9_9CHLO|nr:hypothetical protein HYH02_006447 [Chlamydomonas schloesseri]|eukprot:KAG2448556.1 hypothetical protein HYH02_006447 [Chlamydomonas schloesseri]
MAEAVGPVGLHHYYAAVGNREAKLATLLELLQALQATTSRRHLAICCSARDTLDAVVHALLQTRAFAVTAIHSDLTEKERELALTNFRRGAFGPASTGQSSAAGPGGGAEAGSLRERSGLDVAASRDVEQLPCVLASTDVCLKALPKELLPVGVSLVVEYELPPSKEVYSRRMQALFGGGKDRRAQRCVVVDMVEAGAVGAFRALEGFAASPVLEMPVRVEDMFTARS